MTSTSEFWLNLRESGLLESGDSLDLRRQFAKLVAENPELDNSKSTAAWLIKTGKLSPYQAKVLLQGRKGPFDFGRYRVSNRISEGSLKGWFQANHIYTGHPVILHFLTGDTLKDPNVWTQLAERVKTAGAIKDNLVWRVFDLVDQVSFRYVVLEDPGVEREGAWSTLADKLKSTSRLNASTACHIAWQTASALAHLHQRQFVYGRLSPECIWLDTNNQVKLIHHFDALPRPLNLPVDEANPRLLMAADYMAPECQLPGSLPSHQADIYSLGSILFQMLTGMVPFPGGSIQEKLHRHANDPIDDLSPFGVNDNISQFLNYLMAKNPGTRFQSAQEVADKLALLVPAELKQQTLSTIGSDTLIEYEAALTTESAILNIGPLPPPADKPSPPSSAGIGTTAVDITAGKTSTNEKQKQPSDLMSKMPQATSKKPTSARRHRRKRKSPWANPILWGGLGAGVLGIIMVFVMLNNTPIESEDEGKQNGEVVQTDSNPDGETTNPDEEVITNRTPETGGADTENTNPDESEEGVLLVEDDGETLWQSPTDGDTMDLTWTPPGAQLFISIRMADLLAADGGVQVLDAMGPEVAAAISGFDTVTGVSLDQIDRLILSWVVDEQEQGTAPTIVVHLKEALDRGARSGLLGDPDSEKTENGLVFTVGEYKALIPEQPGILVFGVTESIEAILEWGGKPPLLRRTMAQLQKQSDADRHINVLMAPSFLFTTLFRDGNRFYFGEPVKVREPLQWLLGEGLEAILLSVHFDEVFYLEARMSAGLTLDKRDLITQMRDRMNEIPNKIESYMVDINPSKHWRALSFRFPGMIRFLHAQTRIQVEGQTPILNIAMPLEAAPNILLASELSLASEPGAVSVAQNPTNTAAPQTLEDVLKSPMSVDIPQQDLNLAIADIEMDVKNSNRGLPFEFVIKIDGNDLMDEGITRNQAIRDFVMENKPLEEILTGIVMKANPVTTVQSPTEKDQKLVWLITDDPIKAGNKIILLTTRKAAESKQYTLPSVFVE